MKANKIFVISLLLVLLCQFTVFAQEGFIESLKFKDADIRVVLQAIAQKASRAGRKVNILIAPTVVGTVDVELEKVSWQTALDTVLKTYDYGYTWMSSNVIFVDTLDNLALKLKKRQDANIDGILDTRVFVLNFAEAKTAKDIVQSILTPKGKITYDSRTNSLIITDAQSNLVMLEEAIRALDTIVPQVEIEAKILDITLDLTHKLGINWNLSATASGSKRASTFPFAGRHSDQKYLRDADFPEAPETNFAYGLIDASNLSATLEIIFNDTNTRIISMPKVATLNNNTAKIDVVTKEPVPNYTYNTETGSWEINGFEDKEYGVTLEVTPQINAAGDVILVVKPTVSENIGEKDFSSASGLKAKIPVISTQATFTKVMVKNGQTLVIAGLIKDKNDESIDKIPLLGDIPLLGYAFKHKAKEKEKRNLLIFITPRIMSFKELVLQAADSRN
ncbi:MAG: hypothetical protein NC936_04400 [Candidatus Omnitrophica bacterium]|nr:hypothetical protein [Candidatus Omnitrophota bacterium]